MKGPVNTPGYVLPKATEDTLGGVKVGENLDVEDGKLSVKTDGVWAVIKAKADAIYSLIGHRHDNATKTADGFMSATDKATLDAVAPTYIKGLSVNGQTVTYTKGDGSTGTIKTQDSQYSVFTGASDSAAGTKGLVPTPAKGQGSYYLTGASAWKEFPTTIDNATRWNGYTMRLDHNTSDTWIPVFSDSNIDYVLKSEIASGLEVKAKATKSRQVCYRLGDDTTEHNIQIEWGWLPNSTRSTSYVLPFNANPQIASSMLGSQNYSINISSWSNTGFTWYKRGDACEAIHYIAIGHWS